MPDDIYEVVAQGARYWFLFLMALIVWRSYRWLARDRKQRRKRLKLLPDAGYVGELVVLKGGEELPEGLALPVSNEGLLGCLRGDDLFVPVRGVAKKHLWFEFDNELGLRVEPFGKQTVTVDGQTLTGRQHAFLAHGSKITVGEAELRLRMFAGFEGAGVAYAQDADAKEPAAADAAAPLTPQPAGTIAFTPEQLAAFQQMQWMAAWQAAQAQNAANMAAGQPGTVAAAAPQVLTTEQGEFIVPAQVRVSGEILPSATGEDDDAPYDEPPAAQTEIRQTAAAAPRTEPEAANARAYAVQESGMAEERPAGRRVRMNPLPPLAPDAEMAFPADEMTAENAAFSQPSDFAPEVSADAQWFEDAEGGMYGAVRRAPAAPETDDAAASSSYPTFAPRVTFYPPETEEIGDGATPENQPDAYPDARMPESEAFSPAYAEPDVALPGSGVYPEHPDLPPADEPYEYADEDEAPRSYYVETDEAAHAKRLLWDRYLKGGGRR